MLGHQLKIAARRLAAHQGRALVDLFGLVLGMVCCLLILLYLRGEFAYDRFHRDSDRIFRVTEELQLSGQPKLHWAITPTPLGPALRKDLPGVVAACRIRPYFEGAFPGKAAVSYRNRRQFYDRFYFADASLFRVLTVPLLAGDPATALAQPNTVVISRSAARRYFGAEPPLGKVLQIDSGFSDEAYRVTGVFRDLPAGSHLHFDVLGSMVTLDHVEDERMARGQWYLSEDYTYLKLAPGVPARAVEAALPAFVRRHFPALMKSPPKVALHLQPLADIHLYSHLENEAEANGDIADVCLLGSIAALILLIACVNFMHLSTARYAGRACEVGVRQAVGARRAQLVSQLLAESIVLAALAAAVAAILVWALLPAFDTLVGRPLAPHLDFLSGLVLVGLALAIGVVAGSYPALFLSSFEPAQLLRPAAARVGDRGFRRALIVFQCIASTVLLIGLGVVGDQLRYMRAQDLGCDLQDVVALPIRDVHLRADYPTLKAEIGRLPTVAATTFSSLVLGRRPPSIFTQVEGRPVESLGSLVVDRDFQRVFKIALVAGRPLLPGEEKNGAAGFLVNEAAVRHWGLARPEEALGRPVLWGGWKQGKIVGVVRDFHFLPLRSAIEPLVLHVRPLTFHYMCVRIAPRGRQETLRALAAVWRRILPSKPFEALFLDAEFARGYQGEERLGQILGGLAAVGVCFASLGLLGLASFAAEGRRREIGVRKAMGSSPGEIVLLLSKEPAWLAALAALVAWPLAYVLMRRWLAGFAYRTDLQLASFLAGSLASLAIAGLTVTWRSLRAALADPAAALREE